MINLKSTFNGVVQYMLLHELHIVVYVVRKLVYPLASGKSEYANVTTSTTNTNRPYLYYNYQYYNTTARSSSGTGSGKSSSNSSSNSDSSRVVILLVVGISDDSSNRCIQ